MERTYRELINSRILDVQMKGISTRIKQNMDRIRNVSDLMQAKRWPMELIQNARDVSYDDQAVKIHIALKKDRLSFSHNGKPFLVGNILSIINQVSSKGEGSETVGKFGTGFVTTFQLSERVELSSYLCEEGMPCKPFHITIDRSGKNDEKILAAIQDSMNELGNVDKEAPVVSLDREAFNTVFTYHLLGERSKRAAVLGMEDLQNNVCHILLYSPTVDEVTMEYDTDERKGTVCCRREKDGLWGDTALSNTPLRQMDFKITSSKSDGEIWDEKNTSLVYIQEDNITLAAEWSRECGFVGLHPEISRLFIRFPLIGAEKFPFPVVIDCPDFKSNEPRSGITLVDNELSDDALVNKAKISCAVELYKSFLHQATEIDRRGICNILSIPEWEENKEISEVWVKEHVYQALLEAISEEKLFPIGAEYQSLHNEKSFLINEPREYRGRLRELLRVLPGIQVPDGEDDWYGALKNYPLCESKIWTIERLLDHAGEWLSAVQSAQGEEMEKAEEWLFSLCMLGLNKPETGVQIKSGQIAILPGQAEGAKNHLYTVNELKCDPGIPEILKDVCEQLDRLHSSSEEALYIRNRLLHNRFRELPIEALEDFETTKMEAYIMRRSNRNYPVQSFNFYAADYLDAWMRAWMLLVSCGPDEKFYQLCTPFFHEALPAYAACDVKWSPGIWKPCMVSVMNLITDKISECKTLKSMVASYFEGDEQKAVDWLNSFLSFGDELVLDFGFKKVLPGQDGNLSAFHQMMADATPDDELKEIAQVFSTQYEECDFYKNLIDRRIDTRKIHCSVLTEEQVTMILDRTIMQILSEGRLGDAPLEYQKACGRLLSWLEGNEEKAAKLFPSFAGAEGKTKLMTPAAVADIYRQNRAVEKVLAQAGVLSIEECADKLKNLQEQLMLYQKKERGDVFFSDDWGVIYDGEFLEYDEEEREKMLREIGERGEWYALEQIRQHFLAQGFTLQNACGPDLRAGFTMERNMNGCQEEMTVEFGDRESFHQPGWDIRITHRRESHLGQEDAVYYLEVKTHTLGSCRRDCLVLSREQMKLAAREGERYTVLKVVYDRAVGDCIACTAYQDPIACYGHGRLRLTGEHFVFHVAA